MAARQRAENFQGRHPLFCAALMAVAAVSLASAWPVLAWIWALAAWALGRWIGGWKLALAWSGCGVIAAVVLLARTAERDADERKLLAAGRVDETARIIGDPKGSAGYWAAPAVISSGVHAGVKVWWQGRSELPVQGSLVTAMGTPEPLPPPRNPGEFDKAAWLKRQGVATVFQTEQKGSRLETGWLARTGYRLRTGFRESITDGLKPESRAAMVIRAVVIGEISPDADELIADFRNSGTLHVFMV